jgi:3-isopropylmalate dehydrogenase|tara:strand:+ start:139050 stop:140105 length:1056 start_codon:yes stop_codon:yes gene_type:complete
MNKTLLLLPGDGIGPEVIGEVHKVLDALALDIDVSEALFGGIGIDTEGVPVSDETLARAQAADAVLMGAVGGPQWASQSFDTRPEAGLLKLRAAMNVYANLRPARCFPALADASSLKRELVEGLDIMFVRELVGGVYFGQPRGIEDLPDGGRRGVNSHVYTTEDIRRVARTAFETARQRGGRVCSVEKSNVMEAGLLWREEVTRLHAEDYADIELSHMLADNCAMQLVKNPKQFDTILTDNLFGDLLSDEAAMLTGSLGLLPSAALGEAGKPGLYEPIHGSAPDIAGLGVANPSAAILSLAMAFRYSLDDEATAVRVERAVENAIDNGTRTADIGGTATTAQMGAAIVQSL